MKFFSGQMIAEGIKAIPTGRLGEVEEIANLSTYLCSDYASWINAEVISQCGILKIFLPFRFLREIR